MKSHLPPLILGVALSMFSSSCKKEAETDDLETARRASKITGAEIETMVTVSGQELFSTIGAQDPSGPYENWGSSGGGSGASFHFGGLTFQVPKGGRSYIARRFRNPDGSPFMKVSRYPEDAGKPK